MPRVLIPSLPEDAHATVVAAALKSLGAEAVLWYGADYPASQNQSVEIGTGSGFAWTVETEGRGFGGDGFDVVWARRIQPPQPPDTLHPQDRDFVERELEQYHSALWNAIEPDAFWVNPLTSQRPANSKIFQLRLAERVGMAIPPTLISNAPLDIHRFLERYRDQGTIYKGFYPAKWEEDGRRLALPTRPVTPDDLPDDDMLRAVPGIFQARIEKAFELRLTMFGDHPLAARIESQSHQLGADDWRMIHITELPVSPYRLPPSLLTKVRRFMRSMDIVFGCFDFIVCPDGTHVFLEVNQTGQWLWVEQAAPEMPMLETFCRFLLHGRRDYDGDISASPIELRDWTKFAQGCLERRMPA